MTPLMRKIHKWVGLVIGIQFILWMVSGMVMSLLDSEKVRGLEYRVKPAISQAWPGDALAVDSVVAASAREVQTVASDWLVERPIYRMAGKDGSWLVDALTGKEVPVDAAVAKAAAIASYSGPGQAGEPKLLKYTMETRAHVGEPVWRVDFSDSEETTAYVSAVSGNVLEHRNASWRFFDIVWMLHIMDYAERTNFNNPLLVGSAFGGLALALGGIWLLFASFSLAEFVPQRWRRRRKVSVSGSDGALLRTVETPSGDSVFVALARDGLQLPSNCGGGQSCGLCEVRITRNAPAPTSADRAHLSEDKLAQGYRLACNVQVTEDMEIEVAGGAALTTEYEAEVTGVHPVTPFLREITLRPTAPMAQECTPGSYIQLHVPAYSHDGSQVVVPDSHSADWQALGMPGKLANAEAVRRSYSLSVPVAQCGGQVTLLVRYLAGSEKLPAGVGSSYLYSLKAGDKVRFSGPFGEFAVFPGQREKAFIGGGAGMAPLRAMIRDLLAGGATERIHFWYGARTLRDAPYVAEMEALAAQHPNFSWHLVLSEEAGGGAARGMVHEAARDALLSAHPDLQACDFYLCGPPAMLAATRSMLRELGVADARVAFDDFKV